MAADIVRADAPVLQPATTTVDQTAVTSGWYLRGDAGVEIHRAPGTTIPGVGPTTDNTMNPSGDFGVGVGYQFNNGLRSDVTVDYSTPSTISGTAVFPQSTRVSMLRTMVNAYVDIGNYDGFTPYVGGGFGFTNFNTSDENINGQPMGIGGASTLHGSFALMAGVSYQIQPNMLLDVGYRFVEDGNARTADAGNGYIGYNTMNSHEIRAGLRYLFN